MERYRTVLKGMVMSLALVANGWVASWSEAAVVDLGTSGQASSWSLDVYGGPGLKIASGQPAWQVGNYISLTSDGMPAGTWVAGAGNAEFNGLWTATRTFTVPTGATNVIFQFTSLLSDDRAVLQINGTPVGMGALSGSVVPGSLAGTGVGEMFYPGYGEQALNLSEVYGPPDSLIVSGLNTLVLIVNNTNTLDLTAPARNLNGTGDGTAAYLAATVSYDTDSVPEPATLTMLWLGLPALAHRLRRRGAVTLKPREGWNRS